MSDFKGTSAPWEVDASGYRAPGGGLCVMAGDLCVAVVQGDSDKPQAENARRIVTCVNACDGLPQDALDGGWTAVGISAHAAKLEALNAELLDALSSIRRYGLDTLSGRADGGADDREWQRGAVNEMSKRARIAIEKAARA